MTTANFTLEAKTRTDHGKAYSRRLRRIENAIPAVVYGAGKATTSITLHHNDFKVMLNNEAVYASILTLNVDGKAQPVILKALQRHPWRDEVLHADFLRIKAGENITMNVPLHFIGEDGCPGIKSGGVASHMMTDVEITCLPNKLPEHIDIDVSKLELDTTLHMSDIKLPSGVSLATELDKDHDLPVVSIHLPRVAKAETDEETDGETADASEESTEEKADTDS